MKKPVNIMDTLTPKPPFNPAKKNNSVEFHPILEVETNKYQKISQKGVDRTQKTIDNKKLGIKVDGTQITRGELNQKWH